MAQSSSKVVSITSLEHYQQFLTHDIVCLDCYTTWCGPCKNLAKELEKIVEEFPSVMFAKCDVEAVEGVAEQLGIHSVPTVVLFVGGKQVADIKGNKPLEIKKELTKCTKK